jgi:hypothetical protein
VELELAEVKLAFKTDSVGGEITWHGQRTELADTVQPDTVPPTRR